MGHLDPLAEIEHVWKQLLSPLSVHFSIVKNIWENYPNHSNQSWYFFGDSNSMGFVYAPYIKSGKHQPTYRNIKSVGYVWVQWVLYDINTYIHTLHYITIQYITIHTYIHTYITYIHYITLHYITLHYITLHTYIHTYITLHYITLHTYIHTFIHTVPYHTVPYRTIPYHTNNHTLPARAARTQEKQRLKFSHWLSKGT